MANSIGVNEKNMVRRSLTAITLTIVSVCILVWNITGYHSSSFPLPHLVMDSLQMDNIQHPVNNETKHTNTAYVTKQNEQTSVISTHNVKNTLHEEIDQDVRWTPYMDVLDEREALKEHHLNNIRNPINTKKYIFRVVDYRPTYTIGDEIRINIQLFDSQGRHRTVGGDKLLVRIYEDSMAAGASGYILDYKNGTYTAVVRCLWAGQPVIHVYVDLAREDILFLYDVFNKKHFTKEILVKYKDNEQQPCHAYRHWLDETKPICNMTHINGGISWFCLAPTASNMTCSDVYKFENDRYVLTNAEKGLLNRPPRFSFPLVRINVTDRAQDDQHNITMKPPCSKYNRTQLWFLQSPVGYFIRRKWEMNHCAAPPQDSLAECLQNKHVIFYGDSTVRQWHQNICVRFSCHTCLKVTRSWYRDKWKPDFTAYCDRFNLTIDWVGSAFPVLIHRNFSNAVATHIFRYKDRKDMVFVINLFVHLTNYQPSLFRDRMRQIRAAIEAFLQHNKDAMFFIKGTNSFTFGYVFRYFSYVYRVILIEEFRGLYDKVIYLDNSDANVARDQRNVHPDEVVVTGMVNQMVSYICR